MNDFVEAVALVIGGVVIGLLLAFLIGIMLCWPAMLMFGVVHAFWSFVPAFGFWQTFAVLILARLVVPSGSTRRNK